MKTALICASMISVLTVVANAQNANITWQTPTTISGTSDVSTSGTVVGTWAPGDDAYNPDSLPVNGVTFNAYGSGPFNTISAGPYLDHYTGFQAASTPDSNYNTILQAAIYDYTGSNPIVLTWDGMTAGNTYELEFWVNDGRNSTVAERSETLTGGANTSAALFYGGNGGPGQFIIGTFVADSTGTETLMVTGFGGADIGGSAQVNLMQLRDLTPVPEPSTLAFLALGTGAMLLGFLRKNRVA